MGLFTYRALDKGGRGVKGILDADSLEQAKEVLRQKDVLVTSLKEASRGSIRLKMELILSFTRDLAGLLRSGLPLYESLLTIEEKYQGHKRHALFLDLCDQIKQGRPLSRALAQYAFSPVYLAMVRAGEGTGDLARAFEQLYKVLSRGEAFRKQVRSAMIYPAFLGGFCLLVITGLFVFVIPAMKELLEGRALHPITQTVLRMSGWHWSVWVSGIVGTVGVVFMIKRLCPWQQWALKIPICKTLVTEGVLLRFSRVFSVLLSSGVSIVEALKLARSVMHHPTFERAIAEAEEGIVEGRKLSEALKKSGLFPPLMVRMLATAEETGRPQEMLDHIADLYEGELEQTLVQFTNLLQPVMLLVLGGIVGLILLSVLLPLTDVSTLL